MAKVIVFLAPGQVAHPEQELAKFPEATRNRIAAYASASGRNSRICSQLILEKAVKEMIPQASAVLEDIVRPGGAKPVFKSIGLHFSLSHTRDWVALALCTTQPVGIDIECIDPKLDHFPADYLHEAEKNQLAQLDTAAIPNRFLEFWVQKEAIMKALAKKIYEVPLETINTLEPAHTIQSQQVHCRLLQELPGYSIALASTTAFEYETRFLTL